MSGYIHILIFSSHLFPLLCDIPFSTEYYVLLCLCLDLTLFDLNYCTRIYFRRVYISGVAHLAHNRPILFREKPVEPIVDGDVNTCISLKSGETVVVDLGLNNVNTILFANIRLIGVYYMHTHTQNCPHIYILFQH